MDLQLTFDDGQEKDAVQPILDELKKRNVKAGFFLLGMIVDADPGLAKKIVNAQHVVGNHSWDHFPNGTTAYSDAAIVKQFTDTHQTVASKVSVTMQNWRSPRNEELPRLTGLLSGTGKLYKLSHCDYNADSKDSQGQTTAAGMLNSIKADLAKPGPARRRVLFHVKKITSNALPTVLDGLVSAGHKFVDFSQET